MIWLLVLLLFLLLVSIVVGIYLWRRSPAKAPGDASADKQGAGAASGPRRDSDFGGQPIEAELMNAWRPVASDLNAEERFGPAVIAVGEAAFTPALALERFAGGAPSASEGGTRHLRAYRGEHCLVLQLSDELFRSDARVAERALSKLARRVPSGIVLLVLGIDYRQLGPGASSQLAGWSRVLAAKLPLFAKRGRSVGVRLCITQLDTEAGYPWLRRAWHRTRVAALPLEALDDPERLEFEFNDIESHLGGLLSEAPDQFESAVRLVREMPSRLQALRALTVPLRDALERHTTRELCGVCLVDAGGAAFPHNPFALTAPSLKHARVLRQRVLTVQTAIRSAVGCAAITALFIVHSLWIGWVDAVGAEYRDAPVSGAPEATLSGPGAKTGRESDPAPVPSGGGAANSGDESAPRNDEGKQDAASELPSWALRTPVVPSETNRLAVRSGNAVSRLRFWPLPWAFIPRREQAAQRFVETTRRVYITPALEPTRSLSRRVLAATLDRATEDNDFGELVHGNGELVRQRLGMPASLVDSFVVAHSRVAAAVAKPPPLAQTTASLSRWRQLIVDIADAVRDGIFDVNMLSAARDSAILGELPRDRDEIRVLQRAAKLLAGETVTGDDEAEVNAAQKLDSELEFIAVNLEALTLLKSWLDQGPELSRLPTPGTLKELVDLVATQAVEPTTDAASPAVQASASDEAAQPAPSSVKILLSPEVTIDKEAFDSAMTRTLAHVRVAAFEQQRRRVGDRRSFESACANSRAQPAGAGFFPLDGNAAAEAYRVAALSEFAVSGPTSRGYGPAATLPGWYTKDAFEKYVAPTLIGISERLEQAPISADDRRTLDELIRQNLAAYGRSYTKELGCYFSSFRYYPTTLRAAESALESVAAEESWFARFMAMVATHSKLPLDGIDAPELRNGLAGFGSITQAVESKALQEYSKLLLEALPVPVAPEEAGKPAVEQRLARALNALAPQKDASTGLAAVDRWLRSQNIAGSQGQPFRAPLVRLRAAAMGEIRALWRDALIEPAATLLQRYPFKAVPNDQAVNVIELEEEYGPKGRLWAVVDEVFSPVVVSGPSRASDVRRAWAMRDGLPEPKGLLDFLRAAERLTSALWDVEGKRQPLAIRVTPYDLPSGMRGEPLIALAHLALAGSELQSFNQAAAMRTVDVEWWKPSYSKLSVEVLDEFASRVEDRNTLASEEGQWSFLRLLEGGLAPDGFLRWKAWEPDATVEFELHDDVWKLFRDVSSTAYPKESES